MVALDDKAGNAALSALLIWASPAKPAMGNNNTARSMNIDFMATLRSVIKEISFSFMKYT
jgi:hypothetical protein